MVIICYLLLQRERIWMEVSEEREKTESNLRDKVLGGQRQNGTRVVISMLKL